MNAFALTAFLCSVASMTAQTRALRTASASTGEVIFLGTGSSTGVPHIHHLMQGDERNAHGAVHGSGGKQPMGQEEVLNSLRAAVGNPKCNCDYRNNVSIMVRVAVDGGEQKSVIIDVGKTFREGAVRWFPEHNVRKIDAIVLTHGHADAYFGLDDLRSIMARDSFMDVYLSDECRATVERTFPYLFPVKNSSEKRFVSKVNWRRITNYQTFTPFEGLDMTPLPVKHGEDMECMGYMFGRRDTVVYLSDISRMLPETMGAIMQRKKEQGGISLLIVDALHPVREYFSHFTLEQAVDLAREIGADKTLCVGMSSSFNHEKHNKELHALLKGEGIDMQLAYDGLKVDLDL